jgi:hypothetical protein
LSTSKVSDRSFLAGYQNNPQNEEQELENRIVLHTHLIKEGISPEIAQKVLNETKEQLQNLRARDRPSIKKSRSMKRRPPSRSQVKRKSLSANSRLKRATTSYRISSGRQSKRRIPTVSPSRRPVTSRQTRSTINKTSIVGRRVLNPKIKQGTKPNKKTKKPKEKTELTVSFQEPAVIQPSKKAIVTSQDSNISTELSGRGTLIETDPIPPDLSSDHAKKIKELEKKVNQQQEKLDWFSVKGVQKGCKKIRSFCFLLIQILFFPFISIYEWAKNSRKKK